MPTENDLKILSQKNQTYHIRLDLLDTDYIKISEVEGIATALTFGLSASSDLRANGTLTMYVSDPAYLTDSHENVWLDRLIRINYGLENSDGEITWYLWGSLFMNENSYTYNETTQELSLTLVDMMAAMTEIRGRQIGGYGMLIPEGSNIRNAIISTVALFSPFKQYDVPEFPDTIPYDLEFSSTVYPYTVLKSILALFPTYEMFYSPDGIFTVQEIPTGIDDPVFMDESALDPLVISERKTSRFSDVRNTTELLGMSLSADYTAMSCTTVGNRYELFIMSTFEVLEDGAFYGFTPNTTSVSGQTLKIQDTAELAIYKQSGSGEDSPIAAGAMQADIPYCIKYTNGRFYLQGELDIHVIVQEVQKELTPTAQENFKEANDCRNVVWIINPESPFAADVIGDIRQVLQGGEYDEIYTTELAIERAKYENWLKTRLQDSIELTSVLIPWLEVNKKITHVPLASSKGDDGEKAESVSYSIREISHDISQFTTNIQTVKFYSYYPFG